MRDTVWALLRTIDDPEMPISIVDLGIVEDVRVISEAEETRVEIDILPTFIGCPALPMLEKEITQKVGALDGVTQAKVRFLFEPAWGVDRISDLGRAALQTLGIAVPRRAVERDGDRDNAPVPCPYCDAIETHMTSSFGPTRCRAIFYCDRCKNSFEQMKRLPSTFGFSPQSDSLPKTP